jgi:HSP20 family molecular chaperone IbpA
VLPSEIDESKISADLGDGVLAVRLPKTETVRKKKVEIRSS